MRRAFDHLPELIEAARAFEESHPFRTKPVAGQRAMLLGVVVDERAPEAVRLHLAVEVQSLTVVEGTIAETAVITSASVHSVDCHHGRTLPSRPRWRSWLDLASRIPKTSTWAILSAFFSANK
jgi:hypothetical protein